MCVKRPTFAPAVQGGFTLIEVMVVTAIFAVVIGGIMGVLFSLSKSYTAEDVRAGVQQNVRYGIDFMVQDLREAGLDPLGSANAGIEAATTTSIRFSADRNLNGAIDNSDYELITYTFDSANNQLDQILYEGTASESNQSLIANVSAVTFTFLDSTGTSTTVLADIRTIDISLTIQEPAGSAGYVTRTLNTRVRCRNL